MLDDLLAAWTGYAVLVAIASGIVLGEVLVRMGWSSPRRVVWGLLTIGALWYVPQNVRLDVDPDSTVDVIRNAGAGLLWLVCYAGVASTWYWWRTRR